MPHRRGDTFSVRRHREWVLFFFLHFSLSFASESTDVHKETVRCAATKGTEIQSRFGTQTCGNTELDVIHIPTMTSHVSHTKTAEITYFMYKFCLIFFQCQAGHLVCQHCRPKLTCCPTCRGPLGGNIRNLAMEKVASTIMFPCKYQQSGEFHVLRNFA